MGQGFWFMRPMTVAPRFTKRNLVMVTKASESPMSMYLANIYFGVWNEKDNVVDL